MKKEYKLFVVLGLMAALLGVFLWKRSSANAEREAKTTKTSYPTIALLPEELDKVTKLEITPAGKTAVVLEKKSGAWAVVAGDKSYKANGDDVQKFLESLKALKVTDVIDTGTGAYEKNEVSDGKGTHFIAYKDGSKALDLVFGASGSRGQMVRVVGKDGIYVAGEYKAQFFTKDSSGWRDKSILKFEDVNVASVEVENDNGKYMFLRSGSSWTGTFTKNPNKKEEPKPEEKKDDAAKPEEKKDGAAKPEEKKDGAAKPEEKKDGAKPEEKKADDKKAEPKKDEKVASGDKKPDAKKDGAKPEEKKAEPKKDEKVASGDKKPEGADKKPEGDKKPEEPAKTEEPKKDEGWADFDPTKVDSMLGAFKALNATEFGEAGADTGFNDAVKEGGIIRIKFKDGTEIVLTVGKKQKGSNRFAKKADDDTIFVIWSSAADWVTAEPKKFEKKKDDGKDPKMPPPPMPGGDEDMPEMPDMDIPTE
ncbi:MAG: DUF4340 domain-containing protein [Polyangiaceae bacterium]